MARFPLFGTGQAGKSLHHTAQRRINMYAEPKRNGDRAPLYFYGRPGMSLFSDRGDTPWRGLLKLGNLIYGVHRGTLYSVDNSGIATSRGTLDTTSGRVGMATNGAQILMVDGAEGYTYTVATTTFAKITDADFPVANTCAYQGGRFIVDDADEPGRFWISDSYDGTAWDGLNFATAETFPDDTVAVHVDGSELILFGEESTEIWANVGTLDFPYQRIDGAAIEWGMAARNSVAKHENTVIWLAKNRLGESQVVRLAGYAPARISTPELEYEINGYTSISDATALSYLSAGHPFYQLNFPVEGKSWVYDGLSGIWSEWQHGTVGARHRAEIGVQFLGKTIVSDFDDGKMYQIDANLYADNGVPFAVEMVSRHMFNDKDSSISELWVDMETGTGTVSGAGDNPQAMLQVSKDGGHVYGPERWASVGKQGQYGTRAIWRRLGRAYEWTMRLRVSDPVRVAISGAWVRST